MNRIHSFLAALLIFTISPFELAPLGLSHSDASAQVCSPTVVPKTQVRGLYVSAIHTIVGNNAAEHKLLGWAQGNGFNYLVLYGVSSLLTSPSSPSAAGYALNRQRLGSFIRKAHEFYGIDVGVNVASQSAAGPILDFLSYPIIAFDPFMRYDAVHYEAEYWNGAVTFTEFADTLAWLRTQCDLEDLICEVYIGNPTHDTGPSGPNATGQAEVDLIASYADRIQVTYYRNDPFTPSPNLFKDRLWRLHYLVNTVDPSRIIVLLNGRPSSEPNMYAWLAAQTTPWPQRLRSPFTMWRDCPHGYSDNIVNDTDSLGLPLVNLDVLGYSWYRYQSIEPLTRWGTILKNTFLKKLVVRENKKDAKARTRLKKLQKKWAKQDKKAKKKAANQAK